MNNSDFKKNPYYVTYDSRTNKVTKITYSAPIFGYIHQIKDGLSYIAAGDGIEIASGSNGQITVSALGGGSGAPVSSQYVTLATDATLTNERVLTAGDGISIVDAGAGSTATINWTTKDATYLTLSTNTTLTNERVLTAGTGIGIADGGAGGAATVSWSTYDAQYVTLATNATLTNERVLTAGTGIGIADGGAGAAVTLSSTTYDASYITLATHATLTNERVLTAGTGIAISDGGAGTTATIQSNTYDASYLTIGTHAVLTNERVLSTGTGLSASDGGAGGAYTVSVNTGIIATNLALAGVCGHRLTLSSGNPINTSGTGLSTSVYLTQYISNIITIYDGSYWVPRQVNEATYNLGTLTSGKNYDLFAYWTGSAVALFAAGWTNDTTRAIALSRTDGVYVYGSDNRYKYVGTFRTISTTQTTDTASQRYLWNYYNRVEMNMNVQEGSASWTYGTASWRQVNADSANRVQYVAGIDGIMLNANAQVLVSSTAAGNYTSTGIGIDSTTINSARPFGATCQVANRATTSIASLKSINIVAGYHGIFWLEFASATATSYSANAGWYSGMNASIMA